MNRALSADSWEQADSWELRAAVCDSLTAMAVLMWWRRGWRIESLAEGLCGHSFSAIHLQLFVAVLLLLAFVLMAV